ncbi:MAG: DUF2961 domain-containing protein [Planctomycetes bacterium]|nr:DUF2961 domain-containing protein [Planctomycetota bacterium]
MHPTIYCSVTALVLIVTTVVQADALSEIARTIEGKTHRASSGLFDPESNQDAYHIGPGETVTLTTLPGPGEIRHMWFTLAGRDRRYPRALVLRMYWDGAETPSVETPIGDFFAAGNGMRANVTSLPIQVTSYGRALNCYWRMPFRQTARIALTNEGAYPLTVYWQFDWIGLPRVPDDMLYFHARYRQEFPAQPFAPYVIFDGRGEGHYVGTVFSIQCSYGSWFGESDDRFYIDGETEPSIVGTGCEDFFNDAWNLRLFSNANTGVTIKEANGEDCRFTAYRWHTQAPVIFRQALKVDIERRSFAEVTNPKTQQRELHDFKYRPDFCSSVAFWYQETIAEPFDRFPSYAERVNPEIFLETSDLASEIKIAPGVTAASRSNRVCNLKRALYVDNSRIGGWFEVPCRVDRQGQYSISVFQCLYRTGGIWKVTLQGPAGPILLDRALDFYDPYLAWAENRPENMLYGTWFEKKVGIHALTPGDYVFRFECVGSNPLARASDSDQPGRDCRLDGISLRRFPWDDLYGQMQRYLVQEEKLFGDRIDQARQLVTALDGAVRRFREDTGQYPSDLGELLARPPRFSSAKGKWPYAAEIPTDPWSQHYRYQCPGRFNPEGFDVYSVHGNSRDPSQWIGNWPDPFHFQGALEAEQLEIKSMSDQVTVSKQELTIPSTPPLSGGQLLFVRLRQEGDSISLALPRSVTPGRYSLRVRLVTSRDYGIVRLSFNGTPLGEPVDGYASAIDARFIMLGPVEGKGEAGTLTLQAVGRNPRSTGYRAGIDAVVLTPIR